MGQKQGAGNGILNDGSDVGKFVCLCGCDHGNKPIFFPRSTCYNIMGTCMTLNLFSLGSLDVTDVAAYFRQDWK